MGQAIESSYVSNLLTVNEAQRRKSAAYDRNTVACEPESIRIL
jgi:hypothetical protein